MVRIFALVIVVAFISGCSSVRQESMQEKPNSPSPEQVKWDGYFQKCMSAKNFGDASICRRYEREKYLSEEQVSQAEAQWEKIFQASGPDFHLYTAITSADLEGMQEAIKAGANVNRIFSSTELFGSRAESGKERFTTPLAEASSRSSRKKLEMMELLLENGANPSWRRGRGSYEFDIFTDSLGRSLQNADGTTIIHGEDVGLLLLEYGYEPTLFSAKRAKSNLGSGPKAKKVYEEVMRVAGPGVLAALSKDEHNVRRQTQSRIENVERARNDLQAQIASIRQKKIDGVREIGARICRVEEGRSGVVYVGYVERIAESKVQIRVANSYFKDATYSRPAGFEPSIIWDYPANWQRCE
ncbi:hypothetical protein [Marinobacter sp. SS8-8]|uniref:hypothetical protein n=1 Tax=Marinobacter sp. SS8-8 TaxID=3050452 RepID=UPI0026DFB31A|nr:hypothetical protein [Marinobacter sp. SS8-8]